MGNVEKYKDTPSLLRINSESRVEQVIEILNIIFDSNKISKKYINTKAPKIKSMDKKDLIKHGFIKEIK